MLGDINNGNMACYCTKKRFNLAGSIAVSSFKEILSSLRKSYLSFKEMCEIGSESPAWTTHCIRPNEKYFLINLSVLLVLHNTEK